MKKKMIFLSCIALIIIFFLVIAFVKIENYKEIDNIEGCRKIPTDWKRESCIFRLALTENNETYCEELGQNLLDNPQAKSTYDQLTILQNNQVEITTTYKDMCLSAIAREKLNERICKKIDAEEKRDYCLFNVAILLRNDTICMDISKKEYLSYKNETETQTFTRHNYTKSLEPSEKRCIEYIKMISEEGFCESTPLAESPNYFVAKEKCFEIRATTNLNLDDCEMSGRYKEGCISEVKYNSCLQNKSIECCKKLESSRGEYFCITRIALSEDDPSICNEITRDVNSESYQELRNHCKSNF